MTALSVLYTQATLAANLEIVKIAMVQVALGIVVEPKGIMSDIKFSKRHELAVRCLNDPDNYVSKFSLAALALDQSQGYTTDALKIQAITIVFDKIAGVSSID